VDTINWQQPEKENMYYVFGNELDGRLIYFIDLEGVSIFKFDSEAELQYALDNARQTNPEYKAYRLLEE